MLQRHVPLAGRRGLRVIARRAPRGDRPLAWFYEYDEGVDPDDPAVRAAAEAALAAARDEVGSAEARPCGRFLVRPAALLICARMHSDPL